MFLDPKTKFPNSKNNCFQVSGLATKVICTVLKKNN